jgi:hypothetical protein
MSKAAPKEQESQTTAIQRKVQNLVGTIRAIKVVDDATYKHAGELFLAIAAKEKELISIFGPSKDKAYESYKAAKELYDRALDPLREARAFLNPQLAAYQNKLRAQAEQVRRDAEEKARKELEKKREAHAKELEAMGEKQAAKVTRQTDLVVPKVTIPTAPLVAGISSRETWGAVVVNIKELCQAVVDGKFH